MFLRNSIHPLKNLHLNKKIIEMTPNAMLMIDQNGIIELVNAQTEKLFAYTRNEILDKPVDMLLPERLHAMHSKHRQSFFDNPTTRDMSTGRDLFARRKDGTEFLVEIGLSPISTPEGIKVLASIIDISERRRAAQHLMDINHRFTMAATAAGIGFWDWDISTNTLTWDEWMFKLYGREPTSKEQPYALWSNSLHPDDRQRTEASLQEAVRDGHNFDTEFRIIHPDGSIRFIKACSTVTLDASGEILHMFGINMDITTQREMQEKDRAYTDEMARINAELTSFTYIASHDLKSPLRGIDQLATWIAEDLGNSLPKDTAKHLQLMRNRIKRMEMLLDSLLAYARAGKSEDDIVTLDTRVLIADIFDLAAAANTTKLDLADNLPTLTTKKVPLELVFRNLISNAIKHNNKEMGIIHVSAIPINDGFEFIVEDNGPGIAPEHQERVFGMFQTLKPRDEVEGSGIGLAIIKKTLESVGGNIRLYSDGEHGCKFQFYWPNIISNKK